jgi:hypothetical protein
MGISFETLSSSGVVAALYGDAPVHRVCLAHPKVGRVRSTTMDAMNGPINAMIDSAIIQWKEEDPHATGIVDLARRYAGFRVEQDQVMCPVVVVKESDDLSFEMAELNITFGNTNTCPLLMTQTRMKMDILSKMQGRPVDNVCKNQCEGVLVGLKGIECLVLISLKATDMRLDEIQNAVQRDAFTGHYASESIALCRCLEVLTRLAPYVHTFGDGVLYGFRTPVVNGRSQRVNKSQVRVSKLLWRGLFEGHPVLMESSLVNRVFQPRNRRRDPIDAQNTAPVASPLMHPIST